MLPVSESRETAVIHSIQSSLRSSHWVVEAKNFFSVNILRCDGWQWLASIASSAPLRSVLRAMRCIHIKHTKYINWDQNYILKPFHWNNSVQAVERRRRLAAISDTSDWDINYKRFDAFLGPKSFFCFHCSPVVRPNVNQFQQLGSVRANCVYSDQLNREIGQKMINWR